MAQNSALSAVMDQAAAAAESFTPATGTDVELASTRAVPVAAGYAKPSLQDFAESGGLTVDHFLTIKELGFQLGAMKKGLFDEMIVEIDMSEVVPIYSFRTELNGNTKFIRSYDGITTPQGQNFQAAVNHAEATRGAKNSGVYKTVEIPCTLLEAVESPKDNVTIEAGATIGITPSVTGFKPFQKFLKELSKIGKQKATIKVRVKHAARTNTNNNNWGVAEYELLDD